MKLYRNLAKIVEFDFKLWIDPFVPLDDIETGSRFIGLKILRGNGLPASASIASTDGGREEIGRGWFLPVNSPTASAPSASADGGQEETVGGWFLPANSPAVSALIASTERGRTDDGRD